MNKPLVSIIVVNWNGGEIFKNCLKSLAKVHYPNWELIVVDNGSNDNSLEFIKTYIQNTKYHILVNKVNLGFAPANNQGFKKAKGKYILLLNNDTKVTPNFLTKLVNRIEKDPEIGVIQPKVNLLLKPAHLDSAGSFLTRTGFLQHWGYLARDSRRFNKEAYIFSAKGACMLVRREMIEKVDLFDDSYGSYFEETDFCWRVWLAGNRILYFPKAKILHRVGFSSKRQNQIVVNYNAYKNRLATLIKNLSLKNLILIGGSHLVIITVLMLYYLVRLQFTKAGMIARAIWWNIINLRKILEKRKKVQKKIRIKSDKEIFRYILKPINWKGMLNHFVRSEKMLSGKHEV